MPVMNINEGSALRTFNGAGGRGPQAFGNSFLYNTRGFGVPRLDDLYGIRLLEDTHAVDIPMDTIKTQVSTTPWLVRLKDEDESPDREQEAAIEELMEWLEGGFNVNSETFDHLLKAWIGDTLSIDSGVLELVPDEEGNLTEMYARDGLSFVKNLDQHGRFPEAGSDRPAYYQFSHNYAVAARTHSSRSDLYDLLQETPLAQQAQGFTKPIPFSRDEIVWAEENPRTKDAYGRGRVQKVRRLVEILLNQDVTNLKYFTHNEIPEGLLSIPDAHGNELQRFRSYWKEEVQGQEHKLPILGGDANFIPFRPHLTDLQFLDSQEWYHKLVWMTFGLNQNEVGDVADLNRATAQEQATTVFRRTTRPLMEMLANHINRKILPFLEPYRRIGGGLVFEWEWDNPDIQALERQKDQEDLSSGLATVNEVRRRRGLDEVPWGDFPASLADTLARQSPRWALQQWHGVPEKELPPEDNLGLGFLSASTPTTKGVDEGDEERLPFDQEFKDALRNEQSTGDHAPVVGLAARFQKALEEEFLSIGDDLVKEILDSQQQKGILFDIEKILASLGIAGRLAKRSMPFILESINRGAKHTAGKTAEAIKATLGDDAPDLELMFDVEDTRTVKLLSQAAASRMTTVSDTVKRGIRGVVTDAVKNGESVFNIAEDLKNRFTVLSDSHSRLVARTETLTGSRGGAQAFMDTSDVVQGKQWLATKDARTRSWHLAMDGVIVPKNSTFTVPQTGDATQPKNYPRPAYLVGEDSPFNCFLPDTKVEGTFTGASKLRYDGPAVRLVTASGKRLSVTPNHPILTDSGWKAAGMIGPGDNLVRHTVQVKDAGAKHYHQGLPSTIEEVFEAFPAASTSHLIGGRHLHGDTDFGDGHVQVVGSPGMLLEDVEATFGEPVMEGIFMPTDTTTTGEGLAPSLLVGSSASPSSVMSGFELIASSGLVHPAPLQLLRLGAPSQIRDLPQVTGEGRSGDTTLLRQLQKRHPGLVAFDEVVKVEVFSYAGDVYDSSTAHGWYFAEGIVSKNCRCTQVPVLREDMPSNLKALSELGVHVKDSPLFTDDLTVKQYDVLARHGLKGESFPALLKRLDDGNRSALAKRFGVGRNTLYEWLKV